MQDDRPLPDLAMNLVSADVWKALVAELLLYLPRALFALLVLLAFWLAAKAVQRLIRRTGKVWQAHDDALGVISQTAKLSLLLIGGVTALGTLGVNVAAMVAGLGLTGFALGFALKDIISNLLAGVMIMMYRPFHRRDRISIAGFSPPLEGEVAHIDLRYTTLELSDRRILVPNSNVFTNPITVFRAPAATEPTTTK